MASGKKNNRAGATPVGILDLVLICQVALAGMLLAVSLRGAVSVYFTRHAGPSYFPASVGPAAAKYVALICLIAYACEGYGLFWRSEPTKKAKLLAFVVAPGFAVAMNICLLGWSILALHQATIFCLLSSFCNALFVLLADQQPLDVRRRGIVRPAVLLACLCFSLGAGSTLRKVPIPHPSSGQIPYGESLALLMREWAPRYGDPSAKRQVVVFSDAVCPVCEKYVPWLLEKLAKGHPASYSVVYRHFPLVYHPGAEDLALLEIWAQRNGKFDKLRRLVLKCHGSERDVLAAIESVGLSRRSAEAIVRGASPESQKLRQLLKQDVADGKALGVKGTPCFFIVGSGGQPVDWVLGGQITTRV